jgi:hypothetical protein
VLLKKRVQNLLKWRTSGTRTWEAAMKKEEVEKKPEESNPEGRADDTAEDALKKASEIEHIDDSQLPQSIKDLFKT